MAKKTASRTYVDKIEKDVKSNQSVLSLILGALIILVLGVLIFNYFNKNNPQEDKNATPKGETSSTSTQNVEKYTVKEGDTLFTIAQRAYKDGYKYPEIAKANSLTNENIIEVGQELQIPKLATTSTTTAVAENPSPSPVVSSNPTGQAATGTGGSTVDVYSRWGQKITADTYTVQDGDWLSTIAGRAYGDITAYSKLAQANNISNPDYILPGMVLKIPR